MSTCAGWPGWAARTEGFSAGGMGVAGPARGGAARHSRAGAGGLQEEPHHAASAARDCSIHSKPHYQAAALPSTTTTATKQAAAPARLLGHHQQVGGGAQAGEQAVVAHLGAARSLHTHTEGAFVVGRGGGAIGKPIAGGEGGARSSRGRWGRAGPACSRHGRSPAMQAGLGGAGAGLAPCGCTTHATCSVAASPALQTNPRAPWRACGMRSSFTPQSAAQPVSRLTAIFRLTPVPKVTAPLQHTGAGAGQGSSGRSMGDIGGQAGGPTQGGLQPLHRG